MAYPPDDYLPGPGRRRSPVGLGISIVVALLVAWALYRFTLDRGKPALEPRPITARGDLAADETATIELFRQSSPSVVFITTLRTQQNVFSGIVTEIPQGTGSGFIWD